MSEAPVPANGFERRRQRSRAAILDTALDLFQRRGLRATSLEDICQQADVSPRTFFNHFESREHLYRAIAERRATQVAAVLDAACEDPRPLAARLGGFFATVAAYFAERPLYREFVGTMLSLGADGGSEVVRTGILGRAAAWREDVPCVIHTIHGLAFHPYGAWWRNRMYIAAERYAAKRCHLIACVAEAMRDQALAAGIGRPEQYRIVYSGMEVDAFVDPGVSSAGMRAELGLPADAFVLGTVAGVR